VKFLIPINQKVFRDFRLFVVPVLIENRGRSLYLPMILDTAASYVTVRPDVFGQLDIHPLRKHALVTASDRAGLPTFLEGMTWVDFRVSDPDPLDQLTGGITGERPFGTL
jgi:hypothetical protein